MAVGVQHVVAGRTEYGDYPDTCCPHPGLRATDDSGARIAPSPAQCDHVCHEAHEHAWEDVAWAEHDQVCSLCGAERDVGREPTGGESIAWWFALCMCGICNGPRISCPVVPLALRVLSKIRECRVCPHVAHGIAQAPDWKRCGAAISNDEGTEAWNCACEGRSYGQVAERGVSPPHSPVAQLCDACMTGRCDLCWGCTCVCCTPDTPQPRTKDSGSVHQGEQFAEAQTLTDEGLYTLPDDDSDYWAGNKS